jgi:hypothetical protein
MIIVILIGPSAIIDTKSIALSRASVEGPMHVYLCCHEICNTVVQMMGFKDRALRNFKWHQPAHSRSHRQLCTGVG